MSESFGISYPLKSVLKIIDLVKKNHPSISTNIKTSARFQTLYDTACQLSFLDYDYIISIQTDPFIAGDAFCETGLLSKSQEKLIYMSKLDYGDIIRHSDESEFQEHIRMLFTKIPLLEK